MSQPLYKTNRQKSSKVTYEHQQLEDMVKISQHMDRLKQGSKWEIENILNQAKSKNVR